MNHAFDPTQEQELIIDKCKALQKGEKLRVAAFAGAGKTSTIILIAEVLSKQYRKGIYLAFNKGIAEEAKLKLPNHVEARTFHSLAYRQVSKNIIKKLRYTHFFMLNNFLDFINTTLSVQKLTFTQYNEISKREVKGSITLTPARQFNIVKAAVGLYCRSEDTAPKKWIMEYAARHVLPYDNLTLDKKSVKWLESNLFPYVKAVWKDFKSPKGIFQIPHDVYLKIFALKAPQLPYDYILFDEAQDTDGLMLSILNAQTNTRTIFVGDPYQQIYDWRGAVNAMERIDGDMCYLTKSFRFGENIASVADLFLNYLSSPETISGGNPDIGLIDSETLYPEDIDVILTRTNAGAISIAIDYMLEYPDKRINLHNLDGLTNLVNTVRDISHLKKGNPDIENEALKNFDSYDELAEYCIAFNDSDLCLAFLLEKSRGYKAVKQAVEECHCTNPDVSITTVHRSKGLEWNNVMLAADFQPISYTVKEEGDKQIVRIKNSAECRLLYVAVTRAKKKLYIGHIAPLIESLKGGSINRD